MDGGRRIFGSEQYPAENVKCDDFLSDGLLIFCRSKDQQVSQEENDLGMRPFESMPNMVRILADAGKLENWVLRE